MDPRQLLSALTQIVQQLASAGVPQEAVMAALQGGGQPPMPQPGMGGPPPMAGPQGPMPMNGGGGGIQATNAAMGMGGGPRGILGPG